MSAKPREIWFTVSLSLVIALVLTGFTASYYYLQFSSVQTSYRETLTNLEKISFKISILINYGNGTREWLNNTRIPIGSNTYNATLSVLGECTSNTGLCAKYFPQYMAHFINAINGVGLVKDEQHKNWAWILCLWDAGAKDWKISDVGADALVLQNGQILAWVYEDTSNFPSVEKPS